MKLYVQEIIFKNTDGDYLTTIKTYESKPKWFSYLVWL